MQDVGASKIVKCAHFLQIMTNSHANYLQIKYEVQVKIFFNRYNSMSWLRVDVKIRQPVPKNQVT